MLLFFSMGGNVWYMLSGRISESVPVRRTRNCDAGIRSWRTTKPRSEICTLCVPSIEHVHTFVEVLKKCRKYKFSGKINKSDV